MCECSRAGHRRLAQSLVEARRAFYSHRAADYSRKHPLPPLQPVLYAVVGVIGVGVLALLSRPVALSKLINLLVAGQ